MLPTPAGYHIAIKELIQPGSSQIVIIASATGVVKEFYKHFAQYLFENRCSVITFDYGGIGESRPSTLRNFNTSAQKWGSNDLETVIKHSLENYPEKKITLIGHSIGGQLIGLAPSSVFAEKILLVATSSGYYRFWPFFERIKMLFFWTVAFPIFNKIMGYIPTKRINDMENLPGGMAMEWRKWCLSPNYLFDHVPENELFFKSISVPVSSYSTDYDKFALKASTDWLTHQYTHSEKKRIHLAPKNYGVKKIGHFGFFQKRCSAKLWPELLDVIKRG